jgi:SHOCT-like domain
MSDERKQVLDMLAEGKISVDDAERLLAKLEKQHDPEETIEPAPSAEETEAEPTVRRIVKTFEIGGGKPKALKYLRVLVDSSDGDVVNIRVPLALVRTGIKLSAMLPSDATEKLNKKGVDLSQLNGLAGEELIEALRELNIDVDSSDGDKVRIFCE